MEYIGIKQATEKGYIELRIGGVADFSYPTSKYRRGRVQGGGWNITHNHNNRRDLQSVETEHR